MAGLVPFFVVILCATTAAGAAVDVSTRTTSSPSSSFVTMCRSNPSKREHHKFIRLNTDCLHILLGDGMNPFTGELLGDAKQTYADAGCPYAGSSEDATLWRRYLYAVAASDCEPEDLPRLTQPFVDAGLTVEAQSRFNRIWPLLVQPVGLYTDSFAGDYDIWCNPESVCHVSDYCARTIIASMEEDLLASRYSMYGAALFHNKKITRKKQQTHVDTIISVHEALKHAEATEPCPLADVVAQREADLAAQKQGRKQPKQAVHNCWTFIKKFKKTASLLCKQKEFWEDNECGPSDCNRVCTDKVPKDIKAEKLPPFPALSGTANKVRRQCAALSFLRLCPRVRGPTTTRWLVDSCLPKSLAVKVVLPGRGILDNILATPLTAADAATIATQLCGTYLEGAANRQVLDEVVAAMVAYSTRGGANSSA